MVYPKDESLLGAALGALLGGSKGFSFTRGANPPLVLFIFGRKRVLPVNINSMNITETEFSTDLNPDPGHRRRESHGDRRQERALSVLQGHDRSHVGPEPGQHLQHRQRGGSGISLCSARFPAIANCPTSPRPTRKGAMLAAKDLRLLPDVSGTFRHTVDSGDRLDQLAYKYYSQPLQWWNICDANPEFLSPLGAARQGCRGHHALPRDRIRHPSLGRPVQHRCGRLLGVEDVEIEEDVQLAPQQVTVGGQTITALVEQFSTGRARHLQPAERDVRRRLPLASRRPVSRSRLSPISTRWARRSSYRPSRLDR